MSETSWDLSYLRLAKFWALERSKDPSTQCGAVLVRPDNSVAALAYNGFPIGVGDNPRHYEDREIKYSRVIHAEMNALHLCHDQSVASNARLIDYLYRNGHNTPFEAVTVTFDVKAPIFLYQQWHRHRTQSYNELSARYRPLPEEFYVPETAQITTQSKDNKQMRTDEIHPKASSLAEMIRYQNKEAFRMYKSLLDEGCPREIARTVLPVGTYSHMFATANLNNWFKFLAERLHPHAQYEIRVYAEAVLELLEPIAPVAVAAFKKHTLEGEKS